MCLLKRPTLPVFHWPAGVPCWWLENTHSVSGYDTGILYYTLLFHPRACSISIFPLLIWLSHMETDAIYSYVHQALEAPTPKFSPSATGVCSEVLQLPRSRGNPCSPSHPLAANGSGCTTRPRSGRWSSSGRVRARLRSAWKRSKRGSWRTARTWETELFLMIELPNLVERMVARSTRRLVCWLAFEDQSSHIYIYIYT